MTRRTFLGNTALTATGLVSLPVFGSPTAAYDVVIHGGRVIDPETKLDAVRNVGITARRVSVVTTKPIKGKTNIDAKGMVVCPGFIDPISHGQDLENDRVQILDGVTTKLQLESGVDDVAAWYASQAGHRICNYGAGTGHGRARAAVLGGQDAAAKTVADSGQIAKMAAFIDRGLKAGGLAVGFGLEYEPVATRMEVIEMFRVAGLHHASCHCHVRYGTVFDDQSEVVGIAEVMAAAVAGGAPLHIVHVPSMGLSKTPEALALIERAQRRGFDITCDFYPYTAFGTGIDTEVFSEGWQQRFGIDYHDLEWAKTHERLTAETFEKYKKEGGMVLAHAIPESAVIAALKSPASMVGSDGGLEKGVGHPRSSGTYARILGRYVREQAIVSLSVAIEKMSLRPAKRMQARCEGFKRKGRLQVGADADIVVFDPEKVADRATFDKPAATSVGINWVLVGGQIVVDEGKIVDDKMPGKPLRSRLG